MTISANESQSRRALLIAPTYDGAILAPVLGSVELLDGLYSVLSDAGGYTTQRLDGVLDEPMIRARLRALFDTDGEVLVYFYGHGVVRPPGMTVLCRSEAVPDDEGYPLSELLLVANASTAREVVILLDTCHGGDVLGPDHNTLRREVSELLSRPGRAFLSSCTSTQHSIIGEQATISQFSRLVLEGLQGAGCLPGLKVVSASSLFSFVSDRLSQWGQDPVLLHHETGQHRCHIVQYPDAQQECRPESGQPQRRLGFPFAPSTIFVGREAEIESLRAFLCATDRSLSLSATVEGLGGIGKTELVLQLLHDREVSENFPSMLWFDASAPLEPQWAYFAGLVGLPTIKGKAIPTHTQLTEFLTQHGRVLVVLDNAARWQDIKDSVPQGVSVIATTRSRAFGDSSFIRKELETLSEEASRRFLGDLLPNVEASTLTAIVKRLGGHALALEIAGHYIRDQCSPEEYLERLVAFEPDDADTIADRTHYGRTLAQCLQISWDGLRTDAARSLWLSAALFAPTSAHRDLLRAMSVAESVAELSRYWWEDYPEWNLGDRCTISAAEFPRAYRELRDAHILARVDGYNGERWTMHRLVRDFARRHLNAADIYLHATTLAEWLRAPTVAVEPEAPHIVSAILDLPRFGAIGERVIGRELLHRSTLYSPVLFGESLLKYLGAETGGPQTIGLIFEGIADINPDVRIQAIRMVEELGPRPSVLDALARTLDDPSQTVRRRAATAMIEHGTWSASAMLDHAIATSPRATQSVLETLGEYRSPQSIELLRSACERLTGPGRFEAVIQLGRAGDPNAAPPLLAYLAEVKDPTAYRRIRNALKCVERKSEENAGETTSVLRALAERASDPIAFLAAVELTDAGESGYAQRIIDLAAVAAASGVADALGVAAALAERAPELLADAKQFVSMRHLQRALESLEIPGLREAAQQLRGRGESKLAGFAEERLARIEDEEAKRAARAAAKAEHAQRGREPKQASPKTIAAMIDQPVSSDAWSRWGPQIERAAQLTKDGTPTESPRQAWERVFLAEVGKGTSLADAQRHAKLARDQAAASLSNDPPASKR